MGWWRIAHVDCGMKSWRNSRDAGESNSSINSNKICGTMHGVTMKPSVTLDLKQSPRPLGYEANRRTVVEATTPDVENRINVNKCGHRGVDLYASPVTF